MTVCVFSGVNGFTTWISMLTSDWKINPKNAVRMKYLVKTLFYSLRNWRRNVFNQFAYIWRFYGNKKTGIETLIIFYSLTNYELILPDIIRRRVDDLSFFDCLVHFVFLSELQCTFSYLMKYYNILFIFIIFWLGCDRPSGLLFFRACFASFYTHASILTVFVCLFILFSSCCSHARVFGKTLVHEFPISYSNTEWYLLISDSETASAQCVFGAKN